MTESRKTVEVTNEELLIIETRLNHLKKLQVVRVAHAVVRNLAIIRPMVKALKAANVPSKEYLEFENRRVALLNQMADSDPVTMKPLMMGNTYVVRERKDEFESAMVELREEFDPVIKIKEKADDDYQELLKETVQFEPYMLDFEELPEDVSGTDLDYLTWMVREPTS